MMLAGLGLLGVAARRRKGLMRCPATCPHGQVAPSTRERTCPRSSPAACASRPGADPRLFGACTRRGANAYLQTRLVANDAKYNPTALVDPIWSTLGHRTAPTRRRWAHLDQQCGHRHHHHLHRRRAEPVGGGAAIPLYQDGLKVIPIVTSARDLDLVQTASDGIATVTGQVNAASDLPGQPVEFHVSGPAVNFSNGSNAGIDAGSAKFIFVTQEGTINAWRTKTDPGMLEAVVIGTTLASTTQPRGSSRGPASTAWQ